MKEEIAKLLNREIANLLICKTADLPRIHEKLSFPSLNKFGQLHVPLGTAYWYNQKRKKDLVP